MLGPIAATTSAGLVPNSRVERVERGDRRARGGAAPAGVDGGHDAARPIGHEQRHAVGDANRHRDIGAVRDEARPLPEPLRAAASPSRTTTTVRPCTCFAMATLRAPTAAASRSVSAGDASASCRVVNRCGAIRPSGTQRSAAPQDSVGPLEGVGNVRKAHVGSADASMDIIGTGLDATEISRIADAIERYGDHFVRRVFTEGEIAYCRAKRELRGVVRRPLRRERSDDEGARHRPLARRVLDRRSKWSGIMARRRCSFIAGAAARFAKMGGTGSVVTLTHSRDLAIAHVMLLKS